MQTVFSIEENPCKYGHAFYWESIDKIDLVPTPGTRCACGVTVRGDVVDVYQSPVPHLKASYNLSTQSIAAIETMIINESVSIVNYPEWYADPREAIEVLKRLCKEMRFNFEEIEKGGG